MEARDQALRVELTASGELNDCYHPRLEELHRANASRLRQIIAVFGWPGITLVGDKGAQAAWRIALHSIASRHSCASAAICIDAPRRSGDVPRWQFAIIDDRIRVYEGRPQRYGTQLRHGPDGLEPHPLENAGRASTACACRPACRPWPRPWRKARAQPQPSAAEAAKRDAAELEFRRSRRLDRRAQPGRG